VADYRHAGGVNGVVIRMADEVLGVLSGPERELVRALLLRLVRVADDVPDTRRRDSWHELERSMTGPRSARLRSVLSTLVRHRLVTIRRGWTRRRRR
jgi:hypothetical protein